jgi:hypothetical protein
MPCGNVQGVQLDDWYWRRPAPGEPDESRAGPAVPAGPRYQPPPAMTPPPAGWVPPHVVEPAPARPLPPQDHSRIDEDEARAHVVTVAVGSVIGVLLVVLLCVLCGRIVL